MPWLATPVPLAPRTLHRVLAAQAAGGCNGSHGARSHRPRCHPHPAQPDPLAGRHRCAGSATPPGCRQADGHVDAAQPWPGSLWVGVTPGVPLRRCPSPRVRVSCREHLQESWCSSVGVLCPLRLSLWVHGYASACPGCPSPSVSGCPCVVLVLVQAWASGLSLCGCPWGIPAWSLSVRPRPGLGGSGVSLRGCPCVPVPLRLLQGCVTRGGVWGGWGSRSCPPGCPLADRQTGRGRAPSPPRGGLQGAQPGSA